MTVKPKGKSKASSKPPKTAKAAKAKPARRKVATPREALDALIALAAKDPAAAVEAAPEVMDRLRLVRDNALAARMLLELGRDDATDLAIAHAADGWCQLRAFKLGAADRARLDARLVAYAAETKLHDAKLVERLDLLSLFDRTDVAPAIELQLATMVLAQAHAVDALRVRAIRVLQRDPATRARYAEDASLPIDARVRIALALDPAAAYEQLAPLYRTSPAHRSVILDELQMPADPRWVHAVLADAVDDVARVCDVLVRLRAGDELCDLAARPTLDGIALHALHALGKLGDPRASGLLVDWLTRPAGAERAPLLLTALGTCGDADALAYLTTQLPTAGSRRGFYEHAIEEIRARLS